MNKRIGFFTGARSEYGIMKNLIKEVKYSESFSYILYVSGMHLLDAFGNTIEEIKKDGFHIDGIIEAYNEDNEPGANEFAKIISKFSTILEKDAPDVLFVIGDRPETYAAVLAAHFARVPVVHSGGGTITKGALDNIYRYNISNLATYHFATSLGNYERLKKLPVIDSENVFFTGSFAIDAIKKFQKKPKSITNVLPEINKEKFCLMTFHSVTHVDEPIHEVMDNCIEYIISQDCEVLLTYPNNDPGYKSIISVIKKWEDQGSVFVVDHLGSQGYYAALNDCKFVIGNSSSGIIEASYFNKPVINIGQRQEGRETDEGVTSIVASSTVVSEVLKDKFDEGWKNIPCNNIYGDGNALGKIMNLFAKEIIN